MQLTKDEFKTLLMLCAAGIDGNTCRNEIEEMLEVADAVSFKKASRLFRDMSDIEVLDCINESKRTLLASEQDRQEILASVSAVLSADGRVSTIESQLLRVLNKLLK